MRVELHPCFVLHQRAYRETSLLLDVFSRDHGRIGLVANGVSSRRSQRRLLLQAFKPLLLAWSGKGELQNLTDVEADGKLIGLEGNSLFCGFYMNELLLRLLHRHDPCPEIFLLYQSTLIRLSGDGDIESILRFFEKHLLNALGYGLNLLKDAETGENVIAEQEYTYLAELGPVRAISLQQNDGVKVRGQTLLALASGQTFNDVQTRHEAKILMRYLLSPLLGDKPLHSRKFFKTMK